MRILPSVVISLILLSGCSPPLDDIQDSTCLINLKDSSGEEWMATGWVVDEDPLYYYIMSAGHLFSHVTTTPEKTHYIGALFYKNAQSKYYKLEYVAHIFDHENNHEDLSLMRLLKEDYPFKLKSLQLAKAPPRLSEEVLTHGCPGGQYPSLQFGFIHAVEENGFWYVPEPMGGRSGSPVLNRSGTKIYGLVLMSDGYAVNVNRIRTFLKDAIPSSP